GSRAAIGVLERLVLADVQGNRISAATHLVEGGVGGDPVKPGTRGGGIRQLVELAVGLDEGVLGDVGGAIRVTHHPQRIVVDGRGVGGEEAIELGLARVGAVPRKGHRGTECGAGCEPSCQRHRCCGRRGSRTCYTLSRLRCSRSTMAAYSGAAGLTARAVARSRPAITRSRGWSSQCQWN